MALYKNNSNIAQISLYGGGGTSAALPGVINTSYGANYGTGNTPVIPTTPTPTPVTFTPISFQAGSLVGGANQVNPALLYSQNTLVKPPITSMGANVMIAGSGNYGGGTGGVTDEGVVLGNPNVDNSTFNNITESPSPTYAQFSGEVSTGNDNKVDLSYGGNAGAGTGEGTVTPPVATPPTETVTPPTDTSGSEGGGTNTPTDTTIDSYYDYLKTEMPEHLKGIYTDTIAAIDQANAKTIAEINAAKERGIVDANTSYQHNLSTYGAKNEALRGMGLAGSGYSEYLDSQAYATQRAEVQGVKAGALAAENNANATADAQKLEAKTALDKDLLYYENLAEQHLEGKWSEILAGVGNGTYSKEQVENLAEYYGFSPGQIATLTGAADSYETEKAEADKATMQANYIAALADVRAGLYKESDIDTIAEALGITDEALIANLKEEAKTYQQNTYEANTNTATGNITTDTTDEEIQDFVDQNGGEGKEELEKVRNQARVNEVKDLISYGDTTKACELADSYYDNGNGFMDKNTYQKIYSDSWSKDLSAASISADDIDSVLMELNKDKELGKLSDTDYNRLKMVAWGKVGTAYTPSQAGISDKKEEKSNFLWMSWDKYTKFKMGGTYYKCSTNMWYNPELDGVLNGISTGDRSTTPVENTIVKYNGKTYAYMKHYVSQSAMGAGQITGFYTSWIEVTKE